MLRERVEKAREIAEHELVAVLKRDEEGRPKALLVPGGEGKQYQVLIRRNAAFETECFLWTALGPVPCRGNQNGHVCYHSLAAVFAAAREAGFRFMVTDSLENAERLARIGGEIKELRSRQGSGHLFLVILKKRSAQKDLDDLFG